MASHGNEDQWWQGISEQINTVISAEVAMMNDIGRPPQIALSARLSSRHIVPKFQNTLKMAGTFWKGPL